jgi:hypothetical protein
MIARIIDICACLAAYSPFVMLATIIAFIHLFIYIDMRSQYDYDRRDCYLSNCVASIHTRVPLKYVVGCTYTELSENFTQYNIYPYKYKSESESNSAIMEYENTVIKCYFNGDNILTSSLHTRYDIWMNIVIAFILIVSFTVTIICCLSSYVYRGGMLPKWCPFWRQSAIFPV